MEARDPMRCHPERSKAESKDPVALLEPNATGFLDFARNDVRFQRFNPSTF
jgi:hypothetical protein